MSAATTNQSTFAPLRASNVMLLTTFRRNGEGVGTPVTVNVLKDDKVYFTTWSTTYKVKRLANNPQVTVAPSTRMGKPIGTTINGIARRMTDAEWAVLQVGKKPGLWGRMWGKIYELRGWKPVYYEITPA